MSFEIPPLYEKLTCVVKDSIEFEGSNFMEIIINAFSYGRSSLKKYMMVF